MQGNYREGMITSIHRIYEQFTDQLKNQNFFAISQTFLAEFSII